MKATNARDANKAPKQRNIKKYWAGFKATVAILILSAGTMRTLLLEVDKNAMLVVGLGIVLIFLCVSAVVEYVFGKSQ